MESIISKWGNSLALRLPKHISSSLNISDGSKVSISLKKNKIEITPVQEEEMILETLLNGINPDNLHSELDSGSQTGNEIW